MSLTDIKRTATFAAALLIASPASAATVTRAAPIPVYEGLLMYPDHIEGRHAFGPADGIDFWMGKGKGDRMPMLVASAPYLPHQRASRRGRGYVYANTPPQHTSQFWPVGGGTYWVGDCICDDTPKPDNPHQPDPSPVPVPSAAWLLLSALGILALRKSPA